jgi:hypothetical protein
VIKLLESGMVGRLAGRAGGIVDIVCQLVCCSPATSDNGCKAVLEIVQSRVEVSPGGGNSFNNLFTQYDETNISTIHYGETQIFASAARSQLQ